MSDLSMLPQAKSSKVIAKEVIAAVVALVVCGGLSILISFLVSFDRLHVFKGGGNRWEKSIPSAPLFSFFICFGINLAAWIPASILQTEKFYDLVGGFTFISTTITALVIGDHISDSMLTALNVLPAAMVMVWALRLSGFLFYRVHNSKNGDKRFDELKLNPARFCIPWTLQSLWVFLTSITMVVQVTSPHLPSSLIVKGMHGSLDGRSPTWQESVCDACTVVGVILWISGFALEVTADFQKIMFSFDARNAGRFIDQGVWTWCRHPNYFGEIILWVGVWLMGCRTYTESQWACITSPMLVITLLLWVSGLPQLESGADKKWGHEPEYAAYKQRTHVMIPFLSHGEK